MPKAITPEDPAPSALKRETLTTLTAAWKAMMTVEWIIALDKLDPEARKEAALTLLNVQANRLKLKSAALREIGTALTDNAADLQKGTAKVQASLENLKRTKDVLKTVNALLATVGKVLAVL